MFRILPILVFFAVSACVPNEPGSVANVHTGVSGQHSREFPVNNSLLSSTYVTAIIGERQGETRYGLAVRQISTGMGWSNYREAWSFGTQLPYEVVEETLLGCGGGCSMQEAGVISLTPEQFEAASRNGLEVNLIGSGRNIVIRAPADAFRQALTQ